LVAGARKDFTGLAVGALAVGAPNFKGLAMALAYTKTENLAGLALSTCNWQTLMGSGLFIGLFNYSAELHGAQLGLLNYAGNNSGWKKLLPLLNLHFD